MEDVTIEATAPEGVRDTAVGVEPQSEERITARQKYGWAAGGLAEVGLAYAITFLALPIYNIKLGISAIWLGWALAIPRVMDAILDPLIGNLSDNMRTRWGRRRPFIFIGAIMSAAAFAAVWLPPRNLDKTGLFVWFIVTTIIMFIGYAFFSIGYSALGYELSPHSSQRTKAMGIKYIAANLMILCLAWSLKASEHVGGILHASKSLALVVGIRYVGTAMALTMLLSGILPALLCKEQTEAWSQPKINFWSALKDTVRHKSFMLLMSVSLIILVGTFIVSPMNLYILIFYICRGKEGLAYSLNGYGSTVYSVLGFALPAAITLLGIRWGKKNALYVGIALQLLGYLSTWFLFTPRNPWLMLCVAPLAAIGGIFLGVFLPAMLADICDIDELDTGLRREGMFGAVNAMVGKAVTSLVTVLSGYLLAFSGYIAKQIPSQHTILMMRALYVAIPGVMLLVALVLLWRYPITDQRVKEARAQLDARKKASQDLVAVSAEAQN